MNNSVDIKRNNQFLGVYSRDNLPNQCKPNTSLILNLDNENGPGTHWVCIYNGSPDAIEYFDSYGFPPPEEVINYMKKCNKDIAYSTSQLQSLNSVMCGYYCMYYINERANGKSMYDIIYDFKQLYNDTTNHNDPQLLKNYFNLR